jgi:hypothetical protein
MQHMIEKILLHQWMVVLLAVAFTFSMIAFRARIRRDDKKTHEKKRGDEQGSQKHDDG